MSTILVMFWLELRLRLKSMTIWSLVWIGLGSLLLGLFDSLAVDQADYEKIIQSLPKGLSSSFNIQDNYLSSVEVFLSGQFLTFYTLISAVFASFLGIYLIAGKIEDRTLFQLVTKGVSRSGVYSISVLEGIGFLGISSAFVGTVLYSMANILTKQNTISASYFFSLFLGSGVLSLFFFVLSLILGLFLGKSRGWAIGAGFAGFSWFINTLSKIKGFPEWMQYTSPFYYFDIPQLTKHFELDYKRISVLLVLIVLFSIIGLWKFRKMDVVM